MEFPQSREAVARFEYLAEAGSTNDVLVAYATGADAASWPDLSVLVTDNQTRGRGRLGRTWLAPTGKSLAISVLLRPVHAGEPLLVDHFGWFPLLAGTAMTRAVRAVVEASRPAAAVGVSAGAAAAAGAAVGVSAGAATGAAAGTRVAAGAAAPVDGSPVHEVTLKWPNDVLIDGYKVSGILSELLPDARGLVIGAGLNVSLDEHDLPTLTSTSLMLVTGSMPDPDAVLARYLTELRSLTGAFLGADGDPVRSGLLAAVREVCGTLGALVRVHLPGGADLVGTAIDLDRDGRLIVEDQANGELQAVAAGDVTHLRY